ncbi:MAG: protein translocase subunit SecD [Xanthomonadaceae bacterium]|nr:protein translocase subunit SecD [Rhodospirillaceae bacterium]NIA17714.1 protein translocase subunit SecD [Xanthomonadaceae bacterium]
MFRNIFSKLFHQEEKSNKRKYRFIIFAITLVTIFCFFYIMPNYYDSAIDWLNPKIGQNFPHFFKVPFRLGLDLQGGTHLVYEADVSKIKGGTSEKSLALEGVRDVIERRVNAFGVSEPIVQTNHSGDNWRLIVELAGVHNINQAIKMIGETPILEFKEENHEPSRKLTKEEQKEMDEFNSKALKKAEDIITRIDKGEDFGKLAKEFSEDPGSKDQGGELGFAKRGMMVPEFEKAIFEDLKVGEVTKKPIRTQFGYHIIKKEEVRGGPQPDGTDNTEVRSRHILIRTKSKADFVPPADPWKNTGLSGKQLVKSQVEFNPNTNEPEVGLVFNEEGKKLFSEITKRNIGKKVAIFLDGMPLSIPVVNEQIRDGSAVISGKFDIKEAKKLSQRLNAGALPVPITLISQNTVGASLGKVSLDKSLKAGMWGFFAIIVFLLVVYRLKGLVASIALIIYAILTLSLFKLFGITLTLAGLAGVILSIGMAVDANVLIFERMKEERLLGKTGMRLIDDGFSRAWTSIRDGNISTLLTCLILIWFSTSMVKGFAITLIIGILMSMFSAVVVTMFLLKGFSKR